MDPALLHQLASLLAPAAPLLLAPVAAQLPTLPVAGDIAAMATWLVALSPAQLTIVVGALPRSVATESIRRAQQPPPPPPVSHAPTETIAGDPNVDRDPIWRGFEILVTSDQRLFVVTGPARVGKSRTVELLRLFIEGQGAAHRFIHVDLNETQAVEAVVDTLDSVTRIANGAAHQLRARTDVMTGIPTWAKNAATGILQTIRARLGDGVTPWFVFDHFDNMPPPNDGSASAFFNQLAQEVGNHRLRANAPRAVFVAQEPLIGFARYTQRAVVSAVTETDVKTHLVRRGVAEPVAIANAVRMVAAAKQQC